MLIYVVRHGESEDDLDDSYGGAADFKLTARGRDQASEAGQSLKSNSVDAIYNSPLARAREAAEIIRAQLGEVPSQTVSDLRERNSYGVLSGLTKARARELFAYVLDSLQDKPGYSREPLLGAEDFDEFVARVGRAFSWVVEDATNSGFQTIVIVTHGKFTQALFQEVLQVEGEIHLDLGKINAFEYVDQRANLLAV